MRAPVLAPLLLCVACGDVGPSLDVYAAASLRDALTEAAAAWEADGGARVRLSCAASGRLAQQVLAADKADVFVSASAAWMDEVEEAGLLVDGTRRDLLANRLVLVAPADSTLALPPDLRLAGLTSLALGHTESVPAGVYARAWLERSGQWADLADVVLQTSSVRAALAAVETGAVDAGVVYATDAASSARVRVVRVVPEADVGPIVYPAAALGDDPAAVSFLEFLGSPAARAIFAEHGFLPPPGEAP